MDGSKALAKAIRDVYGARALVQRCQAHKARNVLDQLPDEVRRQCGRRSATPTARATRAARGGCSLRDEHPGAAVSLNEGFDETLTVKRLDLPSKLERQLSTTNSIENRMGSVSSRVV